MKCNTCETAPYIQKDESCNKHIIVSKNPFNIGAVSKLDNNRYLILLSGNYNSYDANYDSLPDWIRLG